MTDVVADLLDEIRNIARSAPGMHPGTRTRLHAIVHSIEQELAPAPQEPISWTEAQPPSADERLAWAINELRKASVSQWARTYEHVEWMELLLKRLQVRR